MSDTQIVVTYTSGRRAVTWTEQGGFTGDFTLSRLATAIGLVNTEIDYHSPDMPIIPGTKGWAGWQIAQAAEILGLHGRFTWEPEPERPPFDPTLIY